MRWAAILLFLLLAGPAPASDEGIRIGYVDTQQLLDNAPQMQAGREELDRQFRPRNDAILADEARLSQLEQEFAVLEADEETRFEREREIRNLARSIERRREDLREEFQFQRNAKVKELQEEIELTVRRVATEHGYDLVLSSPVAYASEAIDITNLVLAALVEEFERQ